MGSFREKDLDWERVAKDNVKLLRKYKSLLLRTASPEKIKHTAAILKKINSMIKVFEES
jgi:aspartate carbamoyltransferase catalytic subunit